uniref:Protein GIGANTEA n=1 Tax=Solanum tuberosum TaxID=4113 RepID=M1BMB9_SOLTU
MYKVFCKTIVQVSTPLIFHVPVISDTFCQVSAKLVTYETSSGMCKRFDHDCW